MENNFNNRDFEQFVKQNADQYRMFPSEKVWNGIHHTLHTRNRWYGIGLALLLATAVSVTWVMLIPSNKNQPIADKLPALATIQPITTTVQKSEPVIITPVRSKTNSTINDLVAGTENNLFSSDLSQPTEQLEGDELADAAPVVATLTAPIVNDASLNAAHINTTSQVMRNHPVNNQVTPVAIATVPQLARTTDKTIVPVVIDDISTEPVSSIEEKEATAVLKDINLLTIESVVNSYKHPSKKSKFGLRAYFTPTISYRRLRENNPFIAASRSNGAPSTTTLAIADVNSVVTHKPDIGLQLGVSGGYPISKRLTVIAGLQFNVNKYDIRAYDYPAETATIALMSGSNGNTVSTETTYRNYSGSRAADWLHNLYFSASLPIGMELRLSPQNKTEIGIAGTVQPTYILGNRTYLLSTDYKNYAEVPSLVRKWNMSTSVEAYAGYSTGKISWRIGPQVRYQLLSSYRKTYPVKEHLFDYGLKIGIMLNK